MLTPMMLYKLLAFVFLCVTTFVLTFAEDSTCKQQADEHDCRCTFANGSFIDLEPINKDGESRAGKKWRFDYKKGSKGEFSYAFNPCFTMKGLTGPEGTNCKKSVVCQHHIDESNLNYYALGNQTTENFESKNGFFYVTYEGSPDNAGLRKSWIKLVCDESASDPIFALNDQQNVDPNYYFTLTSKYCCPTTEGGLSLGSILCILFVVILVVYLVGGILFNKFARGATGAELIPNRAFWADLPGLIKEGFQFTASKITSLCNRDAQYDQI